MLPPEYFKFREECRLPKTPVHYVPKPGKYERNELTGEVRPVQNVPFPLRFPRESHQGIWGGEGVIKGFTQKPMRRRCPHFWMPQLKKTVVRSEILDKFMSLVVTQRTIDLIHQHLGFDNYILEVNCVPTNGQVTPETVTDCRFDFFFLQTKASDLQSLLAMSIKRELLKAIHAGCPALQDEPERQQEILAKYKKFGDQVSSKLPDSVVLCKVSMVYFVSSTLSQYTPTEVEWYGLSHFEAINKVKSAHDAEIRAKIGPAKHVLRQKLIEDLKASGLEKVEHIVRSEDGEVYEQPTA